MKPILVSTLMLLLAGAAQAADPTWSTTTGLQATYGSYGSSVQRDQMSSLGLVLSGDRTDGSGATLGLTRTQVAFKTGLAGINQDALFASGRLGYQLEALPGRLSLRMDVHAIQNDDASNDSNGVRVWAPQVSHLSPDGSRYLDLGYAHSSYRNNLAVRQWTPTLGMALAEGRDWLQVRGWFIEASNPARAQGASATRALEVKWSHSLSSNFARVDKLKASVVLGERIYAVDGDTGNVANLSDLHRGGANIGAEWKLAPKTSLLAMVGKDRYRNTALANDYPLNYAYVWLASQW